MHGSFRAIAISSTLTASKGSTSKQLQPVRPNLGLGVAYRKKLDALIEEMHVSVSYWTKATYRSNPPLLAMDDVLPTNELKRSIARLKKRWLKRFAKAAPKLAKYFAQAASDRSDKQLRKILRKGGFSVRFQMTDAMRDIVEATTVENVSLIKSIASKYLDDVEGMVMRSISAGRDMGTLAKGLEKNYGVTKKRAALIARTQNNMATANMNRARNLELGLTTAIWRHSMAGKVPRPSHLANNGKTYDIAKGWFDPDEKKWIQPGQLINCRCVSIPVVPGFS